MLIINVFIIRAGSDNVNSPPDILHSVQILIIFCPPALHSPVFGSHHIGLIHRHSQFSFPFRISIAHTRYIGQMLSALLLLLRPRFRKLPYRVGLPSFAVLIPFPDFNCSFTQHLPTAFCPFAPPAPRFRKLPYHAGLSSFTTLTPVRDLPSFGYPDSEPSFPVRQASKKTGTAAFAHSVPTPYYIVPCPRRRRLSARQSDLMPALLFLPGQYF